MLWYLHDIHSHGIIKLELELAQSMWKQKLQIKPFVTHLQNVPHLAERLLVIITDTYAYKKLASLYLTLI
jgi:hypothetical protein